MPLDWIAGNGLQTLQLSSGGRLLSLRVHFKLSARQVPLASAALVALALAASPVCWTHYQSMQYPGVALFLAYAASHRLWWLLGIATAAAALLCPIPVALLRAYYERSNQWPNSPVLMYVWTSIPAIASIILFGLMTRELTRIAVQL
jgi:hypothetical protein